MLENLTKKQKIIFAIIIILMTCVIIYYIYSTLNNVDYNHEIEISNNNLEITSDLESISIEENVTETQEILVHISGCVKENKVVSLPDGSRVNDAIEAAGGLTKDADLTNVNLAYILEDGEKIYIPKKGEEISSINNSSISSTFSSTSSSNATSSTKNSKININKATQAELEIIPGIGPSTALKIINYRNENGKFKSIEDVKNISGIGDSKYEKMKDYITIK